MTDLSNEAEITFVATGAGAGAVALYVSTQPIPIEVKTPICVILGAYAAFVAAFWATKVNMKK